MVVVLYIIAIKHVYQSSLIEKGFAQDNEYVIIECKRNHRKPPLIIASLYVPPHKVIDVNLLNNIQRLSRNFLILGDFNATHVDFACSKTNKNGRVLFDWIYDQSISIVGSHEATFEGNHCVAKLDWIFSDFETILDVSDYAVHPLLGSTHIGHRPVTFILQNSFDQRLAATARKQYAFDQANWTSFKVELDRLLSARQPGAVVSERDLIDYNAFLTDCINQAADRAIPLTSSYPRTHLPKPSLTTLQLIRRKHQSYRQMKKEPNNMFIKAEFYRLRLLVTNALLNDRKNSFLDLMQNLSGSHIRSSQMWSTVNRFNRSRPKR